MINLNKQKPQKYFHDIRLDIIELVKDGNNNILEIGCGSGNTGLKLKELGKADRVCGIELNSEMADQAVSKLDKVFCCNIETFAFVEHFEKRSFDYIVFADILEHLYDPWKLVGLLLEFLKTDGYILASLPNIRFWKVLKAILLHKSWEYQVDGVLDITHIRFFAKKNILKLFDNESLQIEAIFPKFKFNSHNRYNKLNKITFHLFEDIITRQYVVKVKKIN